MLIVQDFSLKSRRSSDVHRLSFEIVRSTSRRPPKEFATPGFQGRKEGAACPS
jgi:hypothetical protein